MISVDQHLADVLSLATRLPSEARPLLECLGCVLQEEVLATAPLPGFDNAAMDGYAVRAADIAGAPVSLPVALDIAAGATTIGPLPAGAAARIMTGAPVPTGADCVVQVELTDAGQHDVEIRKSVPAGTAIRRAGDDVREGDRLLGRGDLLTPARVALAAAGGRNALQVNRRPVVTVVSTGAELRAPGSQLEPGQIYDSNGVSLAALATMAGAKVVRQSCHNDNETEFKTIITAAAETSDLILTTGGVSAGAYEVVKQVLGGQPGFTFRQVAMQPGKPQGFGKLANAVVLTLPGNPVSAAVSFAVFAVPVLNRLMGRNEKDLGPSVRRVQLTQEVTRKPVRQFLRGQWSADGGAVTPMSKVASHMIAGLAAADCLIIVPEGTGTIAVRKTVEVISLVC